MSELKLRDYKIIKKIGEGGMGEVFHAKDNIGRDVAIKVLNPLLAKDSELVARFQQEAKAQSALNHPNIITLYNYFIEDGKYCIAMEFAKGITLKEFLINIGLIPEERAIKILMQVLKGLSYAHSKGVIHRDIKPSNIMVDIQNADNVKIMDFGIAKILGDRSLTTPGTKMGTVNYMSPEQVVGDPHIDALTDIYSLGVTFYEMLSGKLPYIHSNESDFILMNKIMNEMPPDPRQYYPYISDNTIHVLFAMLQKDRNIRIPSCEKIIEAIKTKTDYKPPVQNSAAQKYAILDQKESKKKILNFTFIFSLLAVFSAVQYFLRINSGSIYSYYDDLPKFLRLYANLWDCIYFFIFSQIMILFYLKIIKYREFYLAFIILYYVPGILNIVIKTMDTRTYVYISAAITVIYLFSLLFTISYKKEKVFLYNFLNTIFLCGLPILAFDISTVSAIKSYLYLSAILLLVWQFMLYHIYKQFLKRDLGLLEE